MSRLSIALGLTFVFLGACSKKPEATPSHPTAVENPAQGLSGKVLERLDAAGYSYLRLDTASGEQWAAVPATTVAVGVTVTVVNPMAMDGFESKTLGRKFERLVFGSLPGQGGGQATPTATAGAQKPAAAAAPVEQAPGGTTVAQLFAQRTDFKDRPVTVRGRVVKYSAGIMGKNWLHLRDGSGTEDKADHDLTVTTQDSATVGEVVTVTGQVALERNLGAGYSYPVLVENAKLTRAP